MSFDLDTLRAGVTVLSFVCFLGIVVWASAPRRRDDFEEAAHLPLLDPVDGGATDRDGGAR